MKGFFELFPETRQALSGYSYVFENAEILTFRGSGVDKRAELKVFFESLLSIKELAYAEDALNEIYSAIFNIMPVFPKKLLTADYGNEIAAYVRMNQISANGFFNDADYNFIDDRLQIVLKKGGKSTLLSVGADKLISDMLYERFGTRILVEFSELDFDVEKELTEIKKDEDKKSVKAPVIKSIASGSSRDFDPISERSKEHIIKEGIPYYLESVKPFYGNKINEIPVAIKDVKYPENDYDKTVNTVCGKVFGFEEKKAKSGKCYIIGFYLTDDTSAISCKLFPKTEEYESVCGILKNGAEILLTGTVEFNNFDKAHILMVKKISSIKFIEKEDNAVNKRVELHLHTKMSAMDAVSEAADLVKRAIKWGHKAVAITDHGTCQAYPQAEAAAGDKIKILYGVEAYFVNDDEYDDEIPFDYVPENNEPSTEKQKKYEEFVKKQRTYHQIILVKNNTGLKNLYRLITLSNLKFFKKKPRIPKAFLKRYREGLIIGSACEAGELYKAVLAQKSDDELIKIADFYDYLEIQPLENNKFMIEAHSDPYGKHSERNRLFDRIKSFDDIKEMNRRIVHIGDAVGKPVVATCDVHYMDPSDYIYRAIIQDSMGFQNALDQAPIYFRTTDEMLKEFEYLGEDTAKEIVIDNTNRIADMIDVIKPFPKGTFPPSISGAEQELRNICTKKAYELYAKDNVLPELVSERMEKELDSIIKHGFAVMYVIAKRLVEYSEKHGYYVGSRGSVGSSFVASLSGISEVNPLCPHYRCPKCKYTEFFENAEYGSGFDMPEKLCPDCGTPLVRDGHEIPFETFLGFYGDKEPDIDLNFAGEFQSQAHAYTEEMFGASHVFKAGTVSAIKEKNAFGFVKKAAEKWGKELSKAETERLIRGCSGVKKTTSQHPGGMVVVPEEYDVYDFTAVQRPADDVNSNMETTHFDFRSMHDTLLKLDELGHDNPTFYKHLKDLTGIDALDADVCDKKLYELFESPAPLGVSAEDISWPIGTLGLPEMGTPFVTNMLLESKPKTFADLLQISGLSHGTDVWNGNAQDLIKAGTCDISSVIGTRDSIMVYLMHAGLEPGMAFKIMEQVRKGLVAKGKCKAWDEYKEVMRKNNVPDWYISSCEKIQYMFPKAHAAAYVIAALRLAWYKIYYPVEFYAAYYTVKGEDFEAETAVKGREKVKIRMQELTSKINAKQSTKKDEDKLVILQIVNEMMARGIELLPVDLYKSAAFDYIVEDGKIRLPFSSVNGIGATAAEPLARARDDGNGEFYSIEDFKIRSGAGDSIIESLKQIGTFGSLPDSNQMSLF
ncbi:MAG: PolC-type DNA polymerase III [Candidatus Fimenecus sp.]